LSFEIIILTISNFVIVATMSYFIRRRRRRIFQPAAAPDLSF